jgi:hypothetical protein
MDPELKKYLDRISEKQTAILQLLQKQPEKATWLTANQLTRRTGIKGKDLDKMRRLGQVDFKETTGKGKLYKLESVPEVFLNRTA